MGRLKAETAKRHIVAESMPLEAALIEGTISPAHYRGYLAQRWFIHRELEAATGLESRVSILGYVQRGGTPCAADRLLGSRIGTAAAHAVANGQFSMMVAARGEGTELVPLTEVAGNLKLVPLDHEWILSARKLGTGLGD